MENIKRKIDNALSTITILLGRVMAGPYLVGAVILVLGAIVTFQFTSIAAIVMLVFLFVGVIIGFISR